MLMSPNIRTKRPVLACFLGAAASACDGGVHENYFGLERVKLNLKNTRTHVIVVLTVTKHFTCAVAATNALLPAVDKNGQCAAYGYYVTRTRYSTWNRKKTTLFSRLYLRNRSTLDTGVLGYISIL